MRSITRPSFRRAFAVLDTRTQEAARRAYRLFLLDPGHPSLHFKKLKGQGQVRSVRVGEGYRAVGVRDGDTISWSWIGTHNEFDNLFG